ncbi:MAG: phosphatidylglycerol lysyltransferase domain-containing protein [Bacteroidales bacterium]|nr:phosphatidylglycerol lysyltransferase domain-containing protein [Bacteroidales bacterium]
MKKDTPYTAASDLKKKVIFSSENRKIIYQFIFVFFICALAIWFFKHETKEIVDIKQTLGNSIGIYILLGVIVAFLYIFLQGYMYKLSFSVVGEKVLLRNTVLLFLKRNFISVFIPAGGISSILFFSKEIESVEVKKSKIYLASSIYGLAGVCSVVIFAIPAMIYLLFKNTAITSSEWLSLLLILGLLIFVYLFIKSILSKGKTFDLLIRLFPKTEAFLYDIADHTINKKMLLNTILVSMLIDISGFVHLYIAMYALNFTPSLQTAILAYFTALLAYMLSPFMRGLGAVEASMSFVLSQLGFSGIDAISITFLYRFFEFWIPFVVGALSFLIKINKFLLRIIPSILILALGIINIVSALTPGIQSRMILLRYFLPINAITASEFFVLIAGSILILVAYFMIRGFNNAWWIALFLCIISVIGHLTKAIDYEESLIAVSIIVVLILSRKEYYVKTDPKLRFVGLSTSLLCILFTIIYGIVGFYFMDKSHFDIEFTINQSIKYAIQNFFFIGSPDLIVKDHFARNFLYSINLFGLFSMSFLLYTIFKPYISRQNVDSENVRHAKDLVASFGHSPLDYFKTYGDKLIFMPEGMDGFISYRIAKNFAVVLESPVVKDKNRIRDCITQFDRYCYINGLKSIYYRVSEEDLAIYRELGKNSLFIGQEGITDLESFNLEGTKRKALRNAINKTIASGYKSNVHLPPIKDGMLQKLKAVSDDWLEENKRKEIVFSQGLFLWEELKQQVIITVENQEEKIVGFINLIPDYTPHEGTYDLIRKAHDAPNGVDDYLILSMFNYLREQGFKSVNLGLAPLSGSDNSKKLVSQSMRFAYNKINSLAQYRGLRNFKEKFDPEWHNKYLIYEYDFDLLQVPAALLKVFRP